VKGGGHFVVIGRNCWKLLFKLSFSTNNVYKFQFCPSWLAYGV